MQTITSKTSHIFLTIWFLPNILSPLSIHLVTGKDNIRKPEITTALTYPIVDTGQTNCFNNNSTLSSCPVSGAAFYGQDAQTIRYAPHYIVSDSGKTVLDQVTGLTWEQSPDTNTDGILTASDKLTYDQAISRCAGLASADYEGYSDWRLPSIKQLYSLINFDGADPRGYSGTDTSLLTPFIDPQTFQFAYGQTSAGERIIDSQYVSSTKYIYDPDSTGATKIFGVNFADGRIKGYDATMPDNSVKKFFVQCVRGNSSYGINAFTDSGDQTITDSATGLLWTKSDSGTAMNWQDSLAWVQTKNAENFLGHNDWRLPNAKELQSILEYGRSPDTSNSAAIDPIFNATPILNEANSSDWPWYWASTTHAAYNGSGGSEVYLSFGRAGGWQKAIPSAACYTLYDVHGAGAQRSSPKTSSGLVVIGTSCSGGTAYGLGPQGDVLRSSNFVRLVRNVSLNTPIEKIIHFPVILSLLIDIVHDPTIPVAAW